MENLYSLLQFDVIVLPDPAERMDEESAEADYKPYFNRGWCFFLRGLRIREHLQ